LTDERRLSCDPLTCRLAPATDPPARLVTSSIDLM
jgi:hypothetical protein